MPFHVQLPAYVLACRSTLWTEVRRDQKLQEAVSQLEARLGTAPPIYQVREVEPWSRIPERRHALVQLSP